MTSVKFNQSLIFIIALLCGILIGYCTAVIAGALVFLDQQFNFRAWQEGVLVSSVLIGGFCGAIGISGITRKIGPKQSMLMVAFIFIVGSVLTSHVTGYWLLVIARFIVGLAVGAMTMLAPMYVAETSSDKLRGFFVSSVQLAITLGIFLAYLVNYYYSTSGNWSAMFFAAVFPAAILIVLMLFAQESPRWLWLTNQKEKARKVYLLLQGSQWQVEDVEEDESGSKVAWKELFTPIMLPATLLAASLFFFQNLSGIDALLYYAPHIFQNSGFEQANQAFMITIYLGLVNIIGTVISMLLVDKLGRRPLLISGLLVMTLSLLLFGLIQLGFMTTVFGPWFGASLLFAFIIAFSMSMGPIPYLIMSELFPLKLRTLGMSLVSATAWGINAAVTFAYPLVSQHLGLGVFFVLSATFCLIALIISWRFCPETKGCALETIEKNLARGQSIRHIGK